MNLHFDVITLFPDMFNAIKQEGIIARAIDKKIIQLTLWQLRNFSNHSYGNVDDKPYGGGAGMVMQVQPIRSCLAEIKKKRPHTKVIYLSPQGKPLTQTLIKTLQTYEAITLLCGRYQGVDERVIKHDIDLEISLGDFILSGGEIPAMALIDSVGRQLPAVLGNQKSLDESFDNSLLESPLYTRPEVIDGQTVPNILLGGHEAKIKQYNQKQALENTKQKRPDLLKTFD